MTCSTWVGGRGLWPTYADGVGAIGMMQRTQILPLPLSKVEQEAAAAALEQQLKEERRQLGLQKALAAQQAASPEKSFHQESQPVETPASCASAQAAASTISTDEDFPTKREGAACHISAMRP